MSRGLDDVRDDRQPERTSAARTNEPAHRDSRPVVPMRELDLPRTDRREAVTNGDRTYHLRASEARILATVGTFRSVAAHDLDGTRSDRDVWRGDLQRLSEQGLIDRTTVVINDQPSAVVTLTREGRDLLESHQQPADGRAGQTFYADLVKPRELSHDAQLYRLFQAEAAKIEGAGGRVDRVVVDYELKREYQKFLNRADRGQGAAAEDMRTFADASVIGRRRIEVALSSFADGSRTSSQRPGRIRSLNATSAASFSVRSVTGSAWPRRTTER